MKALYPHLYNVELVANTHLQNGYSWPYERKGKAVMQLYLKRIDKINK